MPNFGKTKMNYGFYSFSPVPIFDVSTELIKDGNNIPLALRHTYAFQGTLLESTVSESGVFPSMYLRKELLKRALTESGVQEFRIEYDGNVVQSGIFPRVSNISFAAGVWADRIDYSFQFEFDEGLSGIAPVNSFSETWQFEENEDRRSVSVNHNISAVGINTDPSGTNALINARTFVLNKSGYSNVPAGHPTFVEGSGNLTAYEEKRSESVDVQEGSFSIIENFTLSSGNYIHTQTGQFSTDKDGITTIALDGNIRGLGRGDSAYDRAISALQTYIKPRFPADASGVYSELGGGSTLFTSRPESQSFTKNRFAGTIDYAVSYTDNPASDLPSGVQDFSIAITDDKPVRLFASFPIMERSLGNVVQDIRTPTEGKFQISGSAIGKQGFPFESLLDYVEGKINELKPLSSNYVTLRIEGKSVTKEELKNSVSFNIVFVYTKDLSTVSNPEDDIVLD